MTRLDKLAALHARATKGPWKVEDKTDTGEHPYSVPALVRGCQENHDHAQEPCVLTHFGVINLPDSRKAVRHPDNIVALHTAEFIATLHNAFPTMARVVRESIEVLAKHQCNDKYCACADLRAALKDFEEGE